MFMDYKVETADRCPSGQHLQKTMERSSMLLMGKLTNSTLPFSIAHCAIFNSKL